MGISFIPLRGKRKRLGREKDERKTSRDDDELIVIDRTLYGDAFCLLRAEGRSDILESDCRGSGAAGGQTADRHGDCHRCGHGGYDGGAVGRVSGIPEKGLNLDVAQKLRMLLENQGARVIMTRTDDYALCDENPTIRKKLQDMQRRAAIITEGGAQMVLSIHMNEYAGRSRPVRR